jgi:hypothetical protein
LSAVSSRRLVFESQILRYTVALTPFIVAMLIWRDLALPIAQAPLLMVLLIAVVEMRLLQLSKAARERQISAAEAERVTDALTFRARQILRRIAARRGLEGGELTLTVEQSELARVAPLTLVSVMSTAPQPSVLDLDPTEIAWLETGLFDDDLTERQLQATNQRDAVFVRRVSIETRAVSGHARLAARLAQPQAAPAAAPT